MTSRFTPNSCLSLVLSLTAAALLPAGCTPTRAIAEPFVRDRTGSTARAYQSAYDAQVSTADTLARALESLSDDAIRGANPSSVYDSARRMLLRVEARARNAERTLGYANSRGEDLIDDWQGELRRYSDSGLRNDAEQRLARAIVARDAATESMKRSFRAINPAIEELSDRTLFLKHCRDQGELRPAPVSTEGLSRFAAARRELETALALARASLEDWRTILGQKPLGS